MWFIIGQIFGVLVIVACVINNQFPKRWQMLVGFAVVNVLSTFNLLLVGAGLTVCFPCVVAAIHCPINAYKAKKEIEEKVWEKIFFGFLYFLSWGIGFYISFKNGTASWLDAMPFVATAFFVGSVFVKKERNVRLCTLSNTLIYLVYDMIFYNIAFLAKLFNAISIFIARYRYRDKDKKKV